MTIVELSITLVVLVLAIGGTLSSISSFVVLSDSSWERSLAFTAAQRQLESMQADTFQELFVRYNEDAADDPPGGAPGAGFAVDGLNLQPDDPDGFAGRVEFPVAPATPGSLFENLDDGTFGFPRDLNADGAVDGVDHSLDYVLLPIRIRIEWRSSSGSRSVEISTVLRNG